MALKRFVGDRWTKLDNDPLPTGILSGAFVINLDTGSMLVYDGTDWNPAGSLIDDAVETLVSTWSSEKIAEELDQKVNVEAGKGLSDENYTSAEKSKLAGLESSKYLGQYTSLSALETAHPSPDEGSYGYVDAGVGEDVVKYIWDTTDNTFILQLGESAESTPAEIKTKYESNADTNAFTDSEKSDLEDNTSARHVQGTDQALDTGGANETAASEIRSHIDDPDVHFTVDELDLGSGLKIDQGEIQVDLDEASENEVLYKNATGDMAGSENHTWIPADDVHRVQGYSKVVESSTTEPSVAHNEAVKLVETEVVGSDTITYVYEKLGNGTKVIIASYVQ